MLKLVIVGTVALVASALETHPINQDIVERIRAKAPSWNAHDAETNPLKHKTKDEILGMLGLRFEPPTPAPFLPVQPEDDGSYTAPTEFDSRKKWPDYIHEIRDQQRCGSCWAFGASEAFSDRLAIATDGAINEVFSPEDMVDCDTANMGCQGGYLDKAWDYIKNKGITTDKCYPYTAGGGVEGTCATECADGSPMVKHYCGSIKNINSWFGLLDTTKEIKNEIETNGPMETGFTVYEDFMSYKSGIYHHVEGAQLGGHAVKIIGWGSEDGTDYWICANSWNTTWGEDGFFRIKLKDCGIQNQVIACKPQVQSLEQF